MLATHYHCRPSAILGVEDEWAAYQLDVATFTAGQRRMNEQARKAREEGQAEAKRDRAGRGADSGPAGASRSAILGSLISNK